MSGTARLEPIPDEIEHFDKLAEDKDAMSAVNDFLEQLVEQVELRGSIALFVRREPEEPQVAAGLAQAQQAGQHLHPGYAVICATFPDPLLDLAQKGVVGRPLGWTELARNDLLDFLRQFARDIGFTTTKEEWSKAARETWKLRTELDKGYLASASLDLAYKDRMAGDRKRFFGK